jgi:hypothetical protein
MAGDDERIYQGVEKLVRPILESNARRFERQLNLTREEALQEARLGLICALAKYDYNASRGGIYNFAKIAVRRHFLKEWAKYRTQCRLPHLIVEKDGKREPLWLPFEEPKLMRENWRGGSNNKIARNTHAGPPDFLDLIESPVSAPDASLAEADEERTASAFQVQLAGVLSERDRHVLECKSNPPRGLRMLMLDELATEPTIPLICRFLGLSKNEVDWALRRIREAALELISRDFSDLTDSTIVRTYVDRHTCD